MARKTILNGDETVRRIERAGPHHAKGLEHLSGLTLSGRQGDPFDHAKIDFELSCGTAVVGHDGDRLAISLRSCHVQMLRENCDAVPNTHYEFLLHEGDISGETVRNITSKSSNVIDGEAEASVGLSFMSLTGKLWGKVRGAKSLKRSDNIEAKIKVRPRIELIVTAGQDRWRVGDPRHGDARRTDSKLQGSYFGESQKGNGEPRALCALARRSADIDVAVTLHVSAQLGQVVVEHAEDGKCVVNTVRADVGAATIRRSSRVAKAHQKDLLELKARIAGLVIGKALRDQQGEADICPPDGAFIIGIASLVLSANTALVGASTA